MTKQLTEDHATYLSLISAKPSWFKDGGPGSVELLTDPAQIVAAEAAKLAQLTAKGYPIEWSRVGLVADDQYLSVLRDAVRFPNGQLGTYIRVIPRAETPGVAILPVLEDKIVLLRHFRHATRQWHLEIPRGFGEAKCTIAENARRELIEEVNGKVARLEELGPLYPNTGLLAERVELVFAQINSFGTPQKSEGISAIIMLSVGETEEKIASGEISDAFTIAAFVRARLRKLL